MFDYKVHHKDVKGRLVKYTPYRRIEDKTEGVTLERNGMVYAEDGTALRQATSNLKQLQSYEVRLETQGSGQRMVYETIPNDDVPDPGLTVKQTQELQKNTPEPETAPSFAPQRVVATEEQAIEIKEPEEKPAEVETAPQEPKAQAVAETPEEDQPAPKKRGRPPKKVE